MIFYLYLYKNINNMITVNDLKVGHKVIYYDADEKVVAKVLKKDDETKMVTFVDTDDFEWEEAYDDIPETVRRVLSDF